MRNEWASQRPNQLSKLSSLTGFVIVISPVMGYSAAISPYVWCNPPFCISLYYLLIRIYGPIVRKVIRPYPLPGHAYGHAQRMGPNRYN